MEDKNCFQTAMIWMKFFTDLGEKHSSLLPVWQLLQQIGLALSGLAGACKDTQGKEVCFSMCVF